MDIYMKEIEMLSVTGERKEMKVRKKKDERNRKKKGIKKGNNVRREKRGDKN